MMRNAPQPPDVQPSVLVAIKGCPPPTDAVKRLSHDSNAHIACITDKEINDTGDYVLKYFTTENDFRKYLDDNSKAYSIIGFLDSRFLPVGSWVKNAVRNFDIPEISAVCGPVIPESGQGIFEQGSGFVSSSTFSAGPDNYLYSFRPMKLVKKGLSGNIFFRTDILRKDYDSILISGENVFINNKNFLMKYDPDVTVSQKVPGLFFPYIKMVFCDSFDKGKSFLLKNQNRSIWDIIPMSVLLILVFGYEFFPDRIYSAVLAIYFSLLLISGAICFSLRLLPIVCLGLLFEHITRAVSYPLGLIAGTFFFFFKK